VARECVREAGRIARAAFGRPEDVQLKGRGNIVTQADFAIESRLQAMLASAYPEYRLLSEETHAATTPDGWTWVLDPIDGTSNFALGIPFFCLNLALCFDGAPQLGLTYEPLLRDEFLAVRGRGLRVNRRPALASSKPLREATIGVGTGYDEAERRNVFALVARHTEAYEGIRDLGSAALGLAYAACGRLDLFVHPNLQLWDIAAGILLVEEAGGTITDSHGAPATLRTKHVVAGGRQAHADYLALLR
jgi:fructose-1,6-bisphosphatase/inositol monophosphatase family enzyme